MDATLCEDNIFVTYARSDQEFFPKRCVIRCMVQDELHLPEQFLADTPRMHPAETVADEMTKMTGYWMAKVEGSIHRISFGDIGG